MSSPDAALVRVGWPLRASEELAAGRVVCAGGEVVGEGLNEFVFGDAAVSIVVELAEAVVEFGGVDPGAAEDRSVLIGAEVSAAVDVRSVEDCPNRDLKTLLEIGLPSRSR